MYPNHSREAAGGSALTKSIDMCSIVAACVASFFATPPAFSSTLPYIQTFTAKHYGGGLEQMVSIAWFLLTLFSIFVVCRFWSTLVFLATSSRLFSRFL